MTSLTIDAHPLLQAGVFTTTFPATLAEMPEAEWLVDLLRLDAEAPLLRSEQVRATVRDLLRHGGYKPTGRGKPASEYLVRAASEQALASINLAVDACNAVSLHSGLPISVVDLDRATPPFRIGLGAPGEEYVFNAAGQSIRLDGLLLLRDAEGPCANGVKDAQRTKTGPQTRRTLSVVWGSSALGDRNQRSLAWYRELLERAGASTAAVQASIQGEVS
jgi:DNA/RNA-binding domain of Phe-tRNA-synthetase-like protein